MPALITDIIPPQKFEIVRDQIAAIVGTELAGQYLQDNTKPKVKKIYVERFIPFDAETELPSINVNLEQDDFDMRTMAQENGTAIYNIDVYTIAAGTADTPADAKATIIMQQLVGMICYIFRAPVYRRLGFTTQNFIVQVKVLGIRIADKSTVKDALSSVVGRVQLSVEMVEDITLGDGDLILINNTKARLANTTDGYYFQLIDDES